MRVSVPCLTGALILLTACGGARVGGAAGPSEAPLAMRMPSTPTATFVKTDTVQVSLDMGAMGSMDIPMHMSATLALGFAEVASGLEGTATVQSFQGAVEVPMQGTTTLDESAVSGEMRFSISPTGSVEVTQPFTLETAEAGQLFGSSQVVNDLFPSLPGRIVAAGDSWVDTVTVSDESDGSSSSGETVWTYTLVGDTTVAGARLLVIDGDGLSEISGSGEQGGFQLSQVMSGTLSGRFLWDPAVSLLHSAETTTDLSGIMTIAAMGQELSMTMSGRGWVTRSP